MSRAKFASIALVAAVGFFSSRQASAYCNRTTGGMDTGCTPSAGQCCTLGAPLYWPSDCTSIGVSTAASNQVSLANALQMTKKAFVTWQAASCDNGVPSLNVVVTSTATTLPSPLQPTSSENVLVFRDGAWPYNDSSDSLALTTLTFNPTTGAILNGVIEINSHDHVFSATAPLAADGFDLQSVLTHEAGHFLGLGHSPSSPSLDGEDTAEPVMVAAYSPGSTRTVLRGDDVAAICALYPPEGTRNSAGTLVPALACNPTTYQGQPDSNATVESSCDVNSTPTKSRTSALFALPLAVLGALLISRRRRAKS